MSYKIKVKYLNNLGKVSSYFWTRAIRSMPDGRYGVNISARVTIKVKIRKRKLKTSSANTLPDFLLFNFAEV